MLHPRIRALSEGAGVSTHRRISPAPLRYPALRGGMAASLLLTLLVALPVGLHAAGVCGDGVQDPQEECDDGNQTNGDGCDNNCTVTRCGNRIVTAGEECDDGNATNGDSCDTNCTRPACGNAAVD